MGPLNAAPASKADYRDHAVPGGARHDLYHHGVVAEPTGTRARAEGAGAGDAGGESRREPLGQGDTSVGQSYGERLRTAGSPGEPDHGRVPACHW